MPAIAVIGASPNRRKFGNKAVRAHLKRGWTVYPIHPTEPEIEGLPSHRSVADVHEPLDRVALYVPPEVGQRLIEEIKAAAPKELFFNPGTHTPALLELARRAGLETRVGCAIIEIGESPASY